MTEWCDFPNVKFTKMLSFFSVVEAYDLIYPRPLGENSSFACLSLGVSYVLATNKVMYGDSLSYSISQAIYLMSIRKSIHKVNIAIKKS